MVSLVEHTRMPKQDLARLDRQMEVWHKAQVDNKRLATIDWNASEFRKWYETVIHHAHPGHSGSYA
jgi:hypothetical protein